MSAAPITAGVPGDDDPELIGRCYTKARRSPLVVGAVPGGDGRSLRLVGGPYTFTQLAVMVATMVLLVLTRPVWGGHGLVDVVVLLGAPFAAAFLLRHLHVDGRNPAAALGSILLMVTAPRAGRLNGRPYRLAGPLRADASATVGVALQSLAGATAATTGAGGTGSLARVPRSAPGSACQVPPAGAQVASGVQAVLARRTNLGG